jgi:hypothetical protein
MMFALASNTCTRASSSAGVFDFGVVKFGGEAAEWAGDSTD